MSSIADDLGLLPFTGRPVAGGAEARRLLRNWLIRCGHPSPAVMVLPMATLRAAYSDAQTLASLTGEAIDTVRRAGMAAATHQARASRWRALTAANDNHAQDIAL